MYIVQSLYETRGASHEFQFLSIVNIKLGLVEMGWLPSCRFMLFRINESIQRISLVAWIMHISPDECTPNWFHDHFPARTYVPVLARLFGNAEPCTIRVCVDFRKFNIMDNMIQKLEKYTNNLEGIVAQRTGQLVEEKKKTETLLFRMLPRLCKQKLMKIILSREWWPLMAQVYWWPIFKSRHATNP